MGDIVNRVNSYFEGIDEVTPTDVTIWVNEAKGEHNIRLDEEIPAELVNITVLYARIVGVETLALKTASYFSFTDGEESINKTGISQRYDALALRLRKKYDSDKRDISALATPAAFRIVRRVDRP